MVVKGYATASSATRSMPPSCSAATPGFTKPFDAVVSCSELHDWFQWAARTARPPKCRQTAAAGELGVIEPKATSLS
jgi:hypothetical protein